MGGSKVSVPGPSEEERALQASQKEMLDLQAGILKSQQEQLKVLLPFIAEQEGFDVQVDPETGAIINIEKLPLSEQDQLREEVETGLLKRSLAALNGELPVDPVLEDALADQERITRERLSQQLGPGFETSTAGIETMAELFRGQEQLRSAARRDQLSLSEQLSSVRENTNEARRIGSLQTLGATASGQPQNISQLFGLTAQGFGKAQEPFIQHRQMQLQASIANAQQPSPWAGIGSAVGSIAGLFSDARAKQELTQIGWLHSLGIPIYTYSFKDDPERTRRVGVLAQDVQRVAPHAVMEDSNGMLWINRDVFTQELAAHG